MGYLHTAPPRYLLLDSGRRLFCAELAANTPGTTSGGAAAQLLFFIRHMALFLLSAALPGRGRLLRPRRDFKPCVSVWNTTSAAQHEMDFMRCVTGEEGPPPQLRSALARELLPNASQPVSTVASNLMRDDATSF